MLNKLSIRKKLAIGFGILLLGTLIITICSSSGVSSITNSSKDANWYNIYVQEILQREIDHLKWESKLRDFLDNPFKTKLAIQTNPNLCAFGKWYYSDKKTNFEAKLPAVVPLLKDIEAYHTNLHHSAQKIDNVFKTPKSKAQKQKEAKQIFSTQSQPNLKGVQAKLKEIITLARAKAKQVSKEMHSTETRTQTIVLTVGILSLIIGITLTWLISHSILQPIHKVIDLASKLSKGDLSAQLDMGKPMNCSAVKQCGRKECPSFGKPAYCWVEAGSFSNNPSCPKAKKGEDCRECIVYKKCVTNELDEMGSALNGFIQELKIKAGLAESIAIGDITVQPHVASEKDSLGHALSKMVHHLNELISQIREASSQVKGGAGEISNTSQTLSQSATEQAASLEEISSSIAEVSAQTKSNAENASQANTRTSSVSKEAHEGEKDITEMVTAMEDIKEASKGIAKIIKTIDDIAFQTNILALNAAVEAARAGIHGKGFAVVAEEVRTLATRSAQAAAETSNLIESAVTKIDTGHTMASKASGSFEKIVGGITEISTLTEKIAAASKEQSQGVSQIDTGLMQLNDVTQQNTASAEESAAASEELSSQASLLNELVAHFKVTSDISNDTDTEAQAANTKQLTA